MDLLIALCVLRKIAVKTVGAVVVAPVRCLYGMSLSVYTDFFGAIAFRFRHGFDGVSLPGSFAPAGRLPAVAATLATGAVIPGVAVFLAAMIAWAVGAVHLAPGREVGPLNYAALALLLSLVAYVSLLLLTFGVVIAVETVGLARGVAKHVAASLRGMADQCRFERAERIAR